MEKLYIAGPMTGLPNFNIPAFDAAARHAWDLGFEPVNPADVAREYGTSQPRHFYMRHAARRIAESDAIVLLPDWQHAGGARLEMMIAAECGLRFFDYPHFLAMRPKSR